MEATAGQDRQPTQMPCRRKDRKDKKGSIVSTGRPIHGVYEETDRQTDPPLTYDVSEDRAECDKGKGGQGEGGSCGRRHAGSRMCTCKVEMGWGMQQSGRGDRMMETARVGV